MLLRPVQSIFYVLIILALTQVQGRGQGAALVVPSGHAMPVAEIVFSPQKDLVATAGRDYLLKLRTYPAGKELANITTADQVQGVDFSFDQRYLAYTTSDKLGLFSVSKNALSWEIDYRKAERLAFHPAKPRLYLARVATAQTLNASDTLQINYLDYLESSPKIKSYRRVLVSARTFGSADILSFSRDGRFLLVAGREKEAIYLDLESDARPVIHKDAKVILPSGDLLFASLVSATAVEYAAGSTRENSKWKSVADYGETIFQFGNRGTFACDEQQIYHVVGGKFLTVINPVTGATTPWKQGIPGVTKPGSVAIADRQHIMVGGTGEDTEPLVLNRADLSIVGRLGPAIIGQRYLSNFGKGGGVVLAGAGGINTVLTLTDHITLRREFAPRDYRYAVAGSPDQRMIASFGKAGYLFDNGKLYLSPNSLLGQTQEMRTSVESPYQLTFSPDSRYVLVSGTNGFEVVRVADRAIVQSVTYPGLSNNLVGILWSVSATPGPTAAFSPQSDRLVYMFPRKPGAADSGRTLRCIRLSDGAELWSRTTSAVALGWTEQGCYLYYRKPIGRERLDPQSGTSLSFSPEQIGVDESMTDVVISSSGDLQATTTPDKAEVLLIDWRTKKLIKRLTDFTFRPADLCFLENDMLLTTDMGGKLRLWDGRTGQLLADIVLFQDVQDWAIVTPDGRFDGSETARAKMYYRIGKEFAPLESFYENFYTPGLLGALLSRSFLAPAPAPISTVKPIPRLEWSLSSGTRNLTTEDDQKLPRFYLTSSDVTLRVNATAPEDRVAEIRLYLNGKLLGEGTRGLVVEDDPAIGETLQRTYRFALQPGENSIRILAINSQRTESWPDEILAIYEVPKGEVAAKPTLHLIVAGINDYKNASYNLNYARNDASSFYQQFTGGAKAMFDHVEDHLLLDGAATRQGLLAAFAEVKAEAAPEDVFVFYYAGHGEMPFGPEEDFFLVLHAVTNIFADGAGGARAEGISGAELQRLCAGIPAQKQVFILDACKSANALRNMTRGMAEEKALAQLARATGTHWITAAGSTQLAHELDELGHGLFTYAILQAFTGKADGVRDGQITVTELEAYLNSVVPELALRYRGAAQYPNIFGRGQDFPLLLVR